MGEVLDRNSLRRLAVRNSSRESREGLRTGTKGNGCLRSLDWPSDRLLHEYRAQGHAQSSGEPESNDAAACRGPLALQLAKRNQMKHWGGHIEPIDVTGPKYKESSRLPSDPTRIQSWRGAEFKKNSGRLRRKRSGGGAGANDRKSIYGGPLRLSTLPETGRFRTDVVP